MTHLPSIITDLAIILILGSVFGLLFKFLKQPVVLGYIVAGFLAGPHFKLFPTVAPENISTWADIGVIFLLFGMGLEFSFKKMMSIGRIGGKAVLFEVAALSVFGFVIGRLIGWNTADSLLLGGMLCMSSTAIIVKAFNDMNLQKERFSSIVFGILIFEDLFAILLMVMLSTFAVSKSFEGFELFTMVTRLIFFLVIWFVAGIYLIPTFLKKVKKLLNPELLLLVSMGLCLTMVVLATKAGFSSALGAFIMGSILAETIELENIEKVITPIKDFFGAVFFVSVGMMVDPDILVENFSTVIIIAMASILVHWYDSRSNLPGDISDSDSRFGHNHLHNAIHHKAGIARLRCCGIRTAKEMAGKAEQNGRHGGILQGIQVGTAAFVLLR